MLGSIATCKYPLANAVCTEDYNQGLLDLFMNKRCGFESFLLAKTCHLALQSLAIQVRMDTCTLISEKARYGTDLYENIK